MKCARCERENRADAKFCDDCGTPLQCLERTAEATSSYVDVQESLTEALARESAIGDILRLIGTSPTDAQPVFEGIARSAVNVCAAFSCAVFAVDDDMIGLAATQGVPSERVERFRRELPTPLTAEHDIAQTIRARRIFHLADIEHNPNATAKDVENARLGKYRTRLMVPMVRGDRALGLIAVTRQDPTPFPNQLVELLKTFADQAVIAIENVRLFKELEVRNRDLMQALDRETSSSEILRVINSSPTNVEPVFDAILANGMRLCESDVGLLFLVEQDEFRLVAHRGAPPNFVEPRRRGHRSGPHTGLTRATRERRPVQIDDVLADRAYTERDRSRVETVELLGARTGVWVPMLKEGTPVGVLVTWRREVRPFNAAQIDVLSTFANQAVIALENVRLFNGMKEALEQQMATAEVLQIISRSPTDLQPVLDTVVKSAARFCGADDAIIFQLEGADLRLAAHYGPVPARLGLLLRVVPGTVVARAVLEGRAIHTSDVQSNPDEYPETSAVARKLGYRTQLSVPLLREGTAIGAVSLRRSDVNPFTDKQITLLQTFADQAVIAIENVRLFKELEARNRDLTATGEILQVISRSPTNVQPVFDTIVRNAVNLCDGFFSGLFRVDGGRIHFMAHHNWPPAGLEEYLRTYPIALDDTTLAGQVILERRVLHVEDVSADSAVPSWTRGTAAMIGYRTLLLVPMLREGSAIGVLGIARREARPFSDKQVELVKTFADQAVIAIENVRLFNETKEALEQQTATSGILRIISESPNDVQPVLDAIAERSVRLCGALFSSVYRFDGDLIHMDAHFNYPAAALERSKTFFPTPPHRRLFTARAILQRAVVHVPDVRQDSEFMGPELVEQAGFRAVLSVPMLREGAPVGAITVWHAQVGAFSGKQVELLQTFADQAVIAIENVRLFTELASRNRDLTKALDTQTATSDILGVISRSQTDVQPVFDAIVASALRLLRAYTGALTRVEDGQIVLVALTSTDAAADAVVRSAFPQSLQSAEPHPQVVRERTPLNIADAYTDSRLTESTRAFTHAREFRSWVLVPLLRQSEGVGAIGVTRREPGGFTDEEIALLQTFADQAVIAIENVRLFKELQARTGELTRSVGELRALGDVSHALSSTLDVDVVLNTIVTRANDLIGADGCTIFEYDEGTEQFHLRATRNLEPRLVELARGTPLRKGDQGILGQLPIGRQAVQVPDITAGSYSSPISDALIEAGYRAVVAVPLIREDHLIGALTMNRKTPGEFPAETIELLQTFATQSALAIQNARLFRELADKSRQLEVASQHKSEFLANMSHELRTPLNAVIGFSEVLNERMFGDLNDKQADYLKDIHASGQHLLSLINDILDLSKIEAGKMDLEVSDFDLPATIDNALMLVRERAARRGIDLHKSVDERLGQIHGDERKLRQVLLNLLSNAIKFTPEGGSIEVRAKPVNGSIEVAVSDTGVGIAPEDQDAVFEEFRQVGTADKKVEGTGLGLALSRKFIELHGGKIWVKSQVGAGSTFAFTVPVRRDE